MEIPVRQQPLRQRRERNATDAFRREDVEQPILDPAVEHRVRRLVDQQGSAQIA
jgi:hypothetical protein